MHGQVPERIVEWILRTLITGWLHMVQKRACVACFDAAFALLMVLIWTLCLPAPAYAYVDSSVMTYTIQALAGVAVALSAVLGVVFRRSRKVLMKALHIDENANKTVEDDVHACAEEEAPQEVRYRKHAAKGSLTATDISKQPWKTRFIMSLIVCFFLGFSFGIAAPLEMVAGNPGSFVFSVSDIWLPTFLFITAIVVAVALVLSILRGVAFNLAMGLVCALGLCCWVQAMFMNGGVPAADGSVPDWWGDYAFMMVFSAVVWIAIILGTLVFSVLRRPLAQRAFLVVSVALVIVQGVGLISAAAGSQRGLTGGAVVATEAGMYEVSQNENVIVFILDCFDTQIMQTIVAENPDALTGFDGFTWYPDSAGFSMGTIYCMPYILTGQVPQDNQTGNEYRFSRYLEGTFLPDLNATGYSIGVYSDFVAIEYVTDEDKTRIFGGNTINFKGLDNILLDFELMPSALYECALYRCMPWYIKQFHHFYTDWVNRCVVDVDINQEPDNTLYVCDDAQYYKRLQKFGLTALDNKGAFRLIHLNAAHSPFYLDEYANGVEEGDEVSSAKGSLVIVRAYMQYLKDMGLYDNATIIVMADHGQWGYYPFSPLLMIKQSGQSTGFRVNTAQVVMTEFQGTVLRAMGSPAAANYHGYYEDVPEGQQIVRTTYPAMYNEENDYLQLCEIRGNILDTDSWYFKDKRWDMLY